MGRYKLGYLGVEYRIILKYVWKETGYECVWTGFMLPRITLSGRLLWWLEHWTSGYTESMDIVDQLCDSSWSKTLLCIFVYWMQVWDQDEHENWHLTANWKAHSGSVWKVTWAHPEFGQVLATCSFDRTAAVWEEIGNLNSDEWHCIFMRQILFISYHKVCWNISRKL